MKTSTYLSASAFLIGVCALGNALISMGTTRWSYNIVTAQEFGLFETCRGRRVTCETSIDSAGAYVKATASFMVIGSFSLLSAVVCSLFAIFDRKAHLIGAIVYLLGGIFLLIAPSVYTATVREENSSVIDFGFSIWIAWSSVAISLLASIIQALAIPRKD